jgi:hypothetical protein
VTPRPLFNAKTRQPEKRKRVTLIAGLVCRDAVIFATDSEESIGIRKSTVEKMKYVPEGGLSGALGHDPKKKTSVVVSGAGNGAMCDYAIQRITQEVRTTSTLLDALNAIHNILVDIFKNHIPLLPVDHPSDSEFRLLIGLKAPDCVTPSLYSTEGVTIIRRDKYFSWGSGSVTDYLLNQMYHEGMWVEDGITAALYMLQIAKKYVSGVGGDSHIAVLTSDGRVDDKPSWEISEEENIAGQFTEFTGILLLSLLRTRSGEENDFLSILRIFSAHMKRLRKKKKKSDSIMDNVFKGMAKSKTGE